MLVYPYRTAMSIGLSKPYPRLHAKLLAIGLGLWVAQFANGQGIFVQTLEGFYSPAAVAVGEDGRTFYVTNAARGDYGMFAGKGALSKVRLNDENQLEIVDARFTEELNSPLGLAVLPSAVGPIPAGSIAIAVGGSWTVTSRGTALDNDKERGTGVVFVDPENGEIIGHLFLGGGSPVSDRIGHPIMDPISVAADANGNLVVTDIAGSGVRPLKPEEGRPGILKLSSAAVEALLNDEAVGKDDYIYAPIRNLPTGVHFARHDQSLYWVTGQIAYDLGGAVMRLPNADYSKQAETIDMELGSLLGFTVTPRGTIIASRSNGEVLRIRGRKDKVVKFKDHPREVFASPGQPAATNLADGRVLIVMPEMSGGGRGPWRQRLRTFTLPENI